MEGFDNSKLLAKACIESINRVTPGGFHYHALRKRTWRSMVCSMAMITGAIFVLAYIGMRL